MKDTKVWPPFTKTFGYSSYNVLAIELAQRTERMFLNLA